MIWPSSVSLLIGHIECDFSVNTKLLDKGMKSIYYANWNVAIAMNCLSF